MASAEPAAPRSELSTTRQWAVREKRLHTNRSASCRFHSYSSESILPVDHHRPCCHRLVCIACRLNPNSPDILHEKKSSLHPAPGRSKTHISHELDHTNIASSFKHFSTWLEPSRQNLPMRGILPETLPSGAQSAQVCSLSARSLPIQHGAY